MSSDFHVKIYGCRGSFPTAGVDCVRYGGTTSCVVVNAGGREIVLDAGSGIVRYGNELGKTRGARVSLFLTHAHFDHVIGLPYFAPMYRSDCSLDIWGPKNSRFGSTEATLNALISPPFHPVPIFEMLAKKRFHDINEAHVVYFIKGQDDPVMLCPKHPDDAAKIPAAKDIDVEVHCMRGYNHPKSGVNLYKVISGGKSMVYATDTEGYVNGDRRLIRFCADTDLLIHDAMYTNEKYVSLPVPTQGYGHSTVEIAAEVAKAAGAKKLVLFHHDTVSDDEQLDRIGELGTSLFPNCFVAADGLEIEL